MTFGLYIHIPFCAKLCHYCDFAKTANFSDDHVAKYFSAIESQLKYWLQTMESQQHFTSVFFGGGTPGLFNEEYRSLFAIFKPYLTSDAEITLEANPHNITRGALAVWRELGVNRLSIGVQSFDPQGLTAMTRDHSAEEARDAIRLAKHYIPSVNGDLIYGWPGQSSNSWQQDLQEMVDLGVDHLSLYALTFEGNTPFARAHRRGKMPGMPDEVQGQRYETARGFLAQHDWEHEEISNWAKPGHSCKHNWLYWTAKPYLALGAGAHGFVPNGTAIGQRYAYPGDLRAFLRDCGGSNEAGMIRDDERGPEEWLMEYVGCGLRCKDGIDLSELAKRGYEFKPTANLQKAIDLGLAERTPGRFTLEPSEWFRETAWSGEVLKSLSFPGQTSTP